MKIDFRTIQDIQFKKYHACSVAFVSVWLFSASFNVLGVVLKCYGQQTILCSSCSLCGFLALLNMSCPHPEVSVLLYRKWLTIVEAFCSGFWQTLSRSRPTAVLRMTSRLSHRMGLSSFFSGRSCVSFWWVWNAKVSACYFNGFHQLMDAPFTKLQEKMCGLSTLPDDKL